MRLQDIAMLKFLSRDGAFEAANKPQWKLILKSVALPTPTKRNGYSHHMPFTCPPYIHIHIHWKSRDLIRHLLVTDCPCLLGIVTSLLTPKYFPEFMVSTGRQRPQGARDLDKF